MEEKELIGWNATAWQDPYNIQWPTSGTPSTATFIQDETLTLVDSGEEPSFPGTVVLIPHRASGWEKAIVQLSEGRKYLFGYTYGSNLVYASGKNPLIYEALEEHIGFPDDVVSSIPPWPEFWDLEEAQPASWRGVFYPTYHRKVLFSKTVTLETAKLPRWKPNITIQLRTFKSEDD
jgi:hypothetical protein